MKFCWFTVVAVFALLHEGESDELQETQRDKRQIYYHDITARPRTFRSRADAKDETDRTGHLPLESHYPSPANENYEGELVGPDPHFPQISSYNHEQHEYKPSFSKPLSSSGSIYEGPHKPFTGESLFTKPEPGYQEHKPIFEEQIYNPRPEYRPKPKPVYEEPQYRPKPVYEPPLYKPKPIYGEPHYQPIHVYEEPHFKPKPIYEETHYKPKPVYEEPQYKPKPVYEEPHYTPKPVYEGPIHHGIKKRPQKKESSIPGIAGKDYPTYNEVPYTSFSCSDVPFRPGMYANPEAGCQAYHVCHDDRHGHQGASFLCTNGTLFNQETFSCDWWYNVDCGQAKSFYGLNTDPQYNPYSQKPYFEESHQYKDSVIHSEIYEPFFKENKHTPQFKGTIQPRVQRPVVKAGPTLVNKQAQRQPIYEATIIKESRLAQSNKKSPFDIESNHGSFYRPFTFTDDEQSPAHSTKQKNKINTKGLSFGTQPIEAHSNQQFKLTPPKRYPDANHSALDKFSNNEPTNSYKSPHSEENLKIQNKSVFPESKDIYSRVVANQKRPTLFQPQQNAKPLIPHSYNRPVEQRQRIGKPQPQITNQEKTEKEQRASLKDQENLYFEWGEKI